MKQRTFHRWFVPFVVPWLLVLGHCTSVFGDFGWLVDHPDYRTREPNQCWLLRLYGNTDVAILIVRESGRREQLRLLSRAGGRAIPIIWHESRQLPNPLLPEPSGTSLESADQLVARSQYNDPAIERLSKLNVSDALASSEIVMLSDWTVYARPSPTSTVLRGIPCASVTAVAGSTTRTIRVQYVWNSLIEEPDTLLRCLRAVPSTHDTIVAFDVDFQLNSIFVALSDQLLVLQLVTGAARLSHGYRDASIAWPAILADIRTAAGAPAPSDDDLAAVKALTALSRVRAARHFSRHPRIHTLSLFTPTAP